MNAAAVFGLSVAGGMVGGLAMAQLIYSVIPYLRDLWKRRKADKAMGGLVQIEMHDQGFYPPAEQRHAIGQMMAYMVELGELATTVQNEAIEIAQAKVRGDEYKLTPETARYLILLVGLKQPNREEVWDLVDEACDLLGQEHLERIE